MFWGFFLDSPPTQEDLARWFSPLSWELWHISPSEEGKKWSYRENTSIKPETQIKQSKKLNVFLQQGLVLHIVLYLFKSLFLRHSRYHILSATYQFSNSLRVVPISFLIRKSRCFPNFSLSTLLTCPKQRAFLSFILTWRLHFLKYIYILDIHILNPIINTEELKNKQTQMWMILLAYENTHKNWS